MTQDISNDIQELIPGNNISDVYGHDRLTPDWYPGELQDYTKAIEEWGCGA